VAERAGANTAMISYHFGSKEKLYQATIETIAQELNAAVREEVDRIGTFLDGKVEAITPVEAFEFIGDLLRPFMAFVLSDQSVAKVRLIMREQQDPSAVFIETYGQVMRGMLGLMTKLIATGRRHRRPTSDDRLLAVTVLGQIMVFRCAPAGVMAQMNWKDIGEHRMPQIEARVRANIAAVFDVETDS
jgi:AcrR family transcriptional regulator